MAENPSGAAAGLDPLDDLKGWQGRRTLLNLLQWLMRRLKRLAVPLLVLLFLGLLAWLVMALLRLPLRTPLVTVQSAPYEWPWPPNSWAAEDVDDLVYLDGKTVSVLGQSNRVRTSQDLLAQVSAEALPESGVPNNQPIVYYLSMHGIVDEGEPYLIPPQARPDDPTTWVMLRAVLAEISSVRPGQRKLVILDCHRLPVNWHAGVLFNDFPAVLQQWWGQHGGQFENVAVLNSTGPGQRSWASADLQGSVFGHYFRLGLAGAADQAGNRDREVSVQELHQYLQRTVGSWVDENRGEGQLPMLLGAEDDYRLAQSLNTETLQSLEKQDNTITRVGNTVDSTHFWKAYERLRSSAPYRFEPLAWRDLEHQLLWLEEISNSGKAYQSLASSTWHNLKGNLQDIEARLARFSDQGSIRDACILAPGSNLSLPADLPLHSLPLAEYFQSIQPQVASVARDAIDGFLASSTAGSLQRALELLAPYQELGLAEHQFLQMLSRYQSGEMWRRPDFLSQLSSIQRLADSLAVPRTSTQRLGDERAHYWVRGLLAAADASRRQAEDHLFVDRQPDLGRYLEQAAGQYADVAQQAEQLTAAIETRDESWAKLTYLAQWLAHPSRSAGLASPAAEPDGEVLSNDFLLLADQTRQLAQLIAAHEPLEGSEVSISDRVAEINVAAGVVDERLSSLESEFHSHCRELTRPGRVLTAVELCQMEAALSSPLLTAQLRGELQLRADRTADRLHRQFQREMRHNQEETSPRSEARVMDDYARWVDSWEQHPLLAVLSGDIPPGVTTTLNGIWRNELAALRSKINDSNPAAPRGQWSGLERQLRAVAPVWFAMPSTDPVKILREIDLQALLQWHADRSLRDFWGPAGSGQAYFDLAASDYLESARRVRPAAQPPRAADLEDQLRRARVVIGDWLATTAEDVVLLERGDEAVSRVVVQSKSQREWVLPPGTASVLLMRDGRRIDGVGFAPTAAVPLPLESAELSVTIPGDASQRGEMTNDVRTMFRGHEYPGPLRVSPLGGVRVDTHPHEYQRSQVVLQSPSKSVDVVFVLDCSNSMGEPLEADESRLNVAKAALQEIISRLATRRNVNMGIYFLGHRIGWSTDRPLRVMKSPSYPYSIPSNVTPDRDVEQVLSLGPFDLETQRLVFERLQGLQTPWGQSPLYVALEQVLREDFVASEPDADRHVIVITDGRNYQFRPRAGSGSSVGDVLAVQRQRQVPIHVLGLGMNNPADGQATAEFTRIADESGGVFENLQRSLDLRRTLRAILEPSLYQLLDASGTVIDQGPLGTPVADTSQEAANWYGVRFQRGEEELLLEGGEYLDLYMRPEGDTIHAFPFDNDVAGEADLVLSGSRNLANHVLRAQRPLRSDTDVHFRISLQRYDERFPESREQFYRWTPRPQETWVEITPQSADGQRAGQTYVFYDTNYQPRKPVPLLDLVAHQWPRNATQAEIQTWFRSQTTLPTTALPLARALDQSHSEAGTVDLAVARDVTVQLKAGVVAADPLGADPAGRSGPLFRVRVVERHGPDSAGIGSLKVFPPDLTDLQPTRIVRQFDEEHGLVVHSFYYAGQPDTVARALRAAEISIAARSACHQEGMQSASGVVVQITDAGNLIPLSSQ